MLENDEHRGKLPIYIPLIRIQETKTSVRQLIYEALGLKASEAECVLEAKKCIFFLDGYNEILDPERRKEAAAEIKELINNYENSQFVGIRKVCGYQCDSELL